MKEQLDISVVHLVWIPFGIDLFKQFIDSYRINDPGYPAKLVIVFNGINIVNDADDHLAYMREKQVIHDKLFYFSGGQDIEIYLKVAKELNSEFMFILNSYSRFNIRGWLSQYVANFTETTGAIGATGSFQSYRSSVFQLNKAGWDKKVGISVNFKKYKLLLKAFFYWPLKFGGFPNPHLRTNAFLIRRKHMLSFTEKKIKSKFDAYLFESGRNSLTNTLMGLGLKPLIIDRFGKVYDIRDWKSSLTFWIGKQQNLIISDNQTTLYERADPEEKKLLTKLAWGE